jgi:hypothetical protein
MANSNSPFGFQPYRARDGGVYGRLGSYRIPSGQAENIFTGDLVAMDGGTEGGKVLALATVATGYIAGAAHGVRYVDAAGDVKFARYWPTGTVATGLQAGDLPECLVHDDPDQYFVAQANGAGFVAGDEMETADFATGAGNTKTGTSAFVIDVASYSTSQQLRLIELASIPGNVYGQYAKVVCKIRMHQLAEAFVGLS